METHDLLADTAPHKTADTQAMRMKACTARIRISLNSKYSINNHWCAFFDDHFCDQQYFTIGSSSFAKGSG
jgi:hypothetical protein